MRRLLVPLVCLPAGLGPVPVGAAERASAPRAVESCPGHGPGFTRIPGTDTCLRIAGRTVAEVGASSRRAASGTGFRASGRISADARTDTAYGPVRTFVRLRIGSGSLPER